MHEGNSLKLGGSFICGMTMNCAMLGFIGQRSMSLLDQIWAKLPVWDLNTIQMYQVAAFVNGKDLLGQSESISESFRSKGQSSRSLHDQIWANI